MKRYTLWLTIGVISALTTASVMAQQDQCCGYRVEHKFKLCLPCPIQGIKWTWHTYASAWGPSGTNTTTNSNTAFYSIPSSDTKCSTANVGTPNQTCAFATACATFTVNPIPGTNCIQGSHSAYGRVCTFCRSHGAAAASASSIKVLCGWRAIGQILWFPAFQDAVRGGCERQLSDPVIATWVNGTTGESRNQTLFNLLSRGFDWRTQDSDLDGYPDVAHIAPNGDSGEIEIETMDLDADGYGEELRIHYQRGMVTDIQATHYFRQLPLPAVGDPIQPILIFPYFPLDIVPPGNDWSLDSLQMGGDGESGWRPEDVDGSGCVDDADLLAVLFDFGNLGNHPTDINRDGVVDDADLLAVLFAFGSGC